MTVRRFLNTHYTLPGPDSNGWYRANEFIITAKDGYKISLENLDDSDWTNSLAYTDDTASGSVAFYVRDIQTNEISVSKTENYKLDKTAPEDEIRIKENSFKTFLNTISFGLFFKDTVDVSIDIMNGAYTLSEGTDYTISGGTITFKAAGNYTLTISYNPMGLAYAAGESPDTTSIALTVADASQTTNAAFASTDDDGIIWTWFIFIHFDRINYIGMRLHGIFDLTANHC